MEFHSIKLIVIMNNISVTLKMTPKKKKKKKLISLRTTNTAKSVMRLILKNLG